MAFITISGFGQRKGTIKLYGYVQYASGGKGPEGTGLRVSKGAGKNYFIYASSPSSINATEVWIEGVRYSVSTKTVKDPVEYADAGNIGAPKKVLVPQTHQKLVQLIPNSSINAKSGSTKWKSLALTNALVVVYKQNGKLYYSALKTLSDLQSASMQ